MPATLTTDLLRRSQAAELSVGLDPALNILTSLQLLNSADTLSGLGEWVNRTAAQLSASQLYRAFRRWCMASGERFPPAQEVFTKSARKVIDALSHKVTQARGDKVVLLEYKVIKLDDPINGQRAVRMWKPEGCRPPEGLTEGKWTATCVNDFEEYLGKYMTLLGGGDKP